MFVLFLFQVWITLWNVSLSSVVISYRKCSNHFHEEKKNGNSNIYKEVLAFFWFLLWWENQFIAYLFIDKSICIHIFEYFVFDNRWWAINWKHFSCALWAFCGFVGDANVFCAFTKSKEINWNNKKISKWSCWTHNCRKSNDLRKSRKKSRIFTKWPIIYSIGIYGTFFPLLNIIRWIYESFRGTVVPTQWLNVYTSGQFLYILIQVIISTSYFMFYTVQLTIFASFTSYLEAFISDIDFLLRSDTQNLRLLLKESNKLLQDAYVLQRNIVRFVMN